MDRLSALFNDLFQRRGKPSSKPLNYFLDFSINPKQLKQYISGKTPFIHIAGTNGKGSVAYKCLKGLRAHGLSVGLFQSPHLYRVNERIMLNEEEIPDKIFFSLLERILSRDVNEELHYFKVLFLVALEYFLSTKPDLVILECGLGGRLDPTNIVSPAVTVITQVGLDHMELLGTDRVSIAKEKSGIIKRGIPLVLGSHARGLGIEEEARKKKAPLHLVESMADYNLENSACALCVLELLIPLSERKELDLHLLEPSGRYYKQELMLSGHRVKLIWDVAHNVSALKALVNRLEQDYSLKDLMVAFSMDPSKDIDAAKSFLHQHGVCFTYLGGVFEEAGEKTGSQTKSSNLKAEFNQLLNRAKGKTLVLTGSFTVLSRLKQEL